MYSREIDSKRIPFCIEAAFEDIVRTCQMNYEISHEKMVDIAVFEGPDSENEEAHCPGKDTINSLSAKIVTKDFE